MNLRYIIALNLKCYVILQSSNPGKKRQEDILEKLFVDSPVSLALLRAPKLPGHTQIVGSLMYHRPGASTHTLCSASFNISFWPASPSSIFILYMHKHMHLCRFLTNATPHTHQLHQHHTGITTYFSILKYR